MAAPPLRIPMSLNLDQFEDSITKAKSHTRQAAQFMLKQFSDMNSAIGDQASAALFARYGAGALRLVGVFGAVVASAKIMGDVISSTKDRLVEMVEVADKATARGLSPEFLQSFTAVAKGAEDRVEALEAALDRAFQATKPILNPDWSVWDQGLTKVSAVEKAMRETRELFTTDQNFSGFDLFRNAENQDQKIRAVLLYMQQLKAIGQDVAALDIGEKMFGGKFADDLRLGKESVDNIVRTIESGSKSNFISNDAAKNAKELDDRLNDAWHTISERLKPDWDDLASIALRIKGIWTDLIQSVAEYKTASATARPIAGVNSASDEDSRNNPDPNSAAFANPRLLNQGRRRRGQAPDVVAGSSGDESLGLNTSRPQQEAAPERVPLPLRRPSDAPKPPVPTDEEISAYDREIERLNRTIALRQADAAAVGQTREVQEQYRAELALLQALQKDGEGVTNEQIAIYGRLRNELGQTGALQAAGISLNTQHAASFQLISQRALDTGNSLRVARDAFQGINDSLRFFGDQTASILDGILNKTTTFQQGMQQLLQNVTKQLLNAALTGEGAFAKILGFASATPGGVGGIFGALAGLFGRAGGGSVNANQPYIVGEKGPEIMIPGKSGTVVPNNMVSRGGGGGPTVIINSSPVYQAGMTPTDIASIKAMQAQNNQQLRGQIVNDLRRGVASDSRFLG